MAGHDLAYGAGPRRVELTRVLASALVLVVSVYWLAVASAMRDGSGFGTRLLLLALAGLSLAAWAFSLVPGARVAAALDDALRTGSAAMGTVAIAGPLLVYDWARGDGDRYVWIIQQGFPCSNMGSGPGLLVMFGASFVVAIAAFAYALARAEAPERVVVYGVIVGTVLATLTALLMYPDPSVFAALIGCLR